MPTLRRVVTTTTDPQTSLRYLADFENAAEWDSGTLSCTRTSGDGGVGTVYRNRSSFAGRTVELDYTMEELTDDRMVIVGRTKSATSRDTITVSSAAGGGASVEYVAEFTFSGLVRFVATLTKPLLNRLGNRTATQLEQCLNRLLS